LHLPLSPTGGHSHTFLYGEPAPVGQPQVAGQPPPLLVSPPTNETNAPLGPYPTLIANTATGKTIPVVQALYASR
jgi:5'-nucleotidase